MNNDVKVSDMDKFDENKDTNKYINTKQHTIYKTTGYMTNEEWEEAINYYKEEYKEEYEEENYTEDQIKNLVYDLVYDDNNSWYDDARSNLNVHLNGEILVIANLGLWNGKFNGYKILNNNLNSILSALNCDEVYYYSDGKNIRAEGHHHDGTNYYLFREIKDGVNIDKLKDAIYNNKEISNKVLSYYTKSLAPYVESIFGW